MMLRCGHVLVVLSLVGALAACGQRTTETAGTSQPPDPLPQAAAEPIAGERVDAQERRSAIVVTEAFATAMTPDDNIDSLASWTSADGGTWVFATAKSTDRLVVYDGDTGATLRTVGATGDDDGRFRRPNGVFVINDLLFVVERDNRRVQAFALPELEPLGHFGSEELIKPYGLWAEYHGGSYRLYVTDAYESADGQVPALEQLDQRIKLYRVQVRGEQVGAELVFSFGDTSERGALRIVESIWGDRTNDRLLIAEEDESYANELKVYDLFGQFSGQTIGSDRLHAQAEGIALFACPDGSGYWLTTAQDKGLTSFHLFDRESLEYVGAFSGERTANTDGIWLHQTPTRRFPAGVFYAVHDDQGMVAFDWRDLARALSLRESCD